MIVAAGGAIPARGGGGGVGMSDWNVHHTRSERYAGEAEAAARSSRAEAAACLYRRAAGHECRCHDRMTWQLHHGAGGAGCRSSRGINC